MPGLPSNGGSVALGILVGLLSACVQSVGLTLQRKSHLLEDERIELEGSAYETRPAYRRRRWQLGMLMFLISNIVGSTIQITTLPLPVLSTLQASGLVFNTACATVLLKEPFTRYSVIGTVLVASGAILIALFGAMSEPSHSLDQLLTLLGNSQFLLWISGTFFLVVCILIAIYSQDKISIPFPPRLSRSVSQLQPLQNPSSTKRLLNGLAFGSVSGILSAHTLLIAKSAVELLVRTIVDRVNQFDRWQSWVILLGLVGLALAQLYFLHRGLKLCSTSVLYPFVFCIYNIVAILDGLIYFQQTSRLSVSHAILIALGTVILLAGVFALSWRLDPEYVPSGNGGVSMISTPASPLDAKAAAAARVQTPGSALVPGLGLVEQENVIGATEEEDQDLQDMSRSAQARKALFGRSSTPNEITPLLRTRTDPMSDTTPTNRHKHAKAAVEFNVPATQASPGSPLSTFSPFGSSQGQIRNPRVRRATTQFGMRSSPNASRVSLRLDAVDEAEQSEIWEEVANDTGNDARNFSTAERRASPHLQRSNSGKFGGFRRQRIGQKPVDSGVWGSLVDRANQAGGSIKGGLKGLGLDVDGWKAAGYGTLTSGNHPEEGVQGEQQDEDEVLGNQDGTVRRYPGRNRAATDGQAGWFRMNNWEWWRRPWRREDEERSGVGVSEEVEGA